MAKRIVLMMLVVCSLIAAGSDVYAGDLLLKLGPEQLVQADGNDIVVPGYSVPSFVDWDNDGLNDLIVGQGGGSYPPVKVRVYINEGTESSSLFSTSFYAQSNGSDLVRTGSGCMGSFPRVVYWDGDDCKDLLIGRSDGKVEIFINIGIDSDPNFDGGTLLQVGQPGLKTNITVGGRATPCVVDWNNDGKKDLVVGAIDGKIHIYINEGTDTLPDFRVKTFAQAEGSDLDIGSRSSPVVMDLDRDGKKDILTGNTGGELLFYSNKGTDGDPNFSGYELVKSDGVAIHLPNSPRSRPFVCDWTGDGYPDVLIGVSDGKVHLYESIPQPGDIDKDYDVDFDDLAWLGLYWMWTDCGKCGYADLTGDDSKVNFLDLYELAAYWLEGVE